VAKVDYVKSMLDARIRAKAKKKKKRKENRKAFEHSAPEEKHRELTEYIR